jgi:hypothetical protein
MKPKQLANVLIRILGLSMIAHGVPGLINSLFGWIQYASDNHASLLSNTSRDSHYWMVVLYDLYPFVIGVALIFGSRCLVEKLFKDEVE